MSIPSASSLQWVVVIGASLVAAVWDIRSRRIPNWLTAPLFLAGVIQAVWSTGLPGLRDSLLGCLLLSGTFVILFLIGGGGAADAKLMGAIGAWLGVSNGVAALMCVLVCGAVLGLCYAVIKKQGSVVGRNTLLIGLGAVALMSGRVELRHASDVMPQPSRMLTMPYGLAIFIGVGIAAVYHALL